MTSAPAKARALDQAGSCLLTELGPYDVLLGRGTGPNENEGNVKFRDLLKEWIDSCWTVDPDAAHREHGNSRQIANQVIDAVKAQGGHFVRKLSKEELRCTTASNDKLTSRKYRYVTVPDKIAREKTKQSIRFQIRSAEKKRRVEDQQRLAERVPLSAPDSSPITSSRKAVLDSILLQAQRDDISKAMKKTSTGLFSTTPRATSRHKPLSCLQPTEGEQFKLAESLLLCPQSATTANHSLLNLLPAGGVAPSAHATSTAASLLLLMEHQQRQQQESYNLLTNQLAALNAQEQLLSASAASSFPHAIQERLFSDLVLRHRG